MSSAAATAAHAKAAHDKIAAEYAGAGRTSPHFAAYEAAKATLNEAHQAMRAEARVMERVMVLIETGDAEDYDDAVAMAEAEARESEA